MLLSLLIVCSGFSTSVMVFAAIVPEAATAGTPMPGNDDPPQANSPLIGVVAPFSSHTYFSFGEGGHKYSIPLVVPSVCQRRSNQCNRPPLLGSFSNIWNDLLHRSPKRFRLLVLQSLVLYITIVLLCLTRRWTCAVYKLKPVIEIFTCSGVCMGNMISFGR